MLTPDLVNDILKRSFREDIGSGDLTTIYCVPSKKSGSGLKSFFLPGSGSAGF